MTYREFPHSLSSMAREQERPRLIGSARTAGRSASGIMHAGRVDGGGLWTYGFSGVPLNTADHFNAWEALGAYLAEGATPIVVPFCNKRYFPAPIVDGSPVYNIGPIPHGDGTLFDDGTAYAQHVVIATVRDAAAMRATTLVLRMTYSGVLRGWHPFTIDHEPGEPEGGPRLYGITQILEVDGADYTVKIEPPLRADVAAGDEVDFDRPRCVMQLAGAMPVVMDLGRFARPSVTFVESFLPEPS